MVEHAHTESRIDVGELVDGSRLVFIGGLHRSGTSILHRCLSDHPRVSGFQGTGVPEDEGQHLQSVFPTAASHGGPGLFGLDPRSYLDESSPLVSPENARRILESWTPHWDTSQQILLEKSPPNLIRTRFLKALFPRARFVIVTRDPIAVGYATQKWTSIVPALRRLGLSDHHQPKAWIHTLIDHWVRTHERFQEDRDSLDRVYELRYEDFVREPQQHLDALCGFLGLETSPLGREVRQGVNDRYRERWSARTRNPLTRPYTSWVVRRFEPRVLRLGYSLVSAEPG
jgi:hypothetical protein